MRTYVDVRVDEWLPYRGLERGRSLTYIPGPQICETLARPFLQKLADASLSWKLAGSNSEFVEARMDVVDSIVRLRRNPVRHNEFELLVYQHPNNARYDDRYWLAGYLCTESYGRYEQHLALRIWNNEPSHAAVVDEIYTTLMAQLDTVAVAS